MLTKNPHNLPDGVELLDTLETELNTVYFYPRMVVSEAREGVTISYKTGFSILLKILRIGSFKKCVYISNRINSYSVNPTDYKYLNKIPSLAAIAIVAPTESARQNAELEKKFFNGKIEVFETILDAYHWTQKMLNA